MSLKPCILLVEDEPGIVGTLQCMLSTYDFAPVWCSIAEEILR
jgi:DNA-binding response OmpR family regulator